MKKIQSQKQLLEDIFAVEDIHSVKNKVVVHTDVFKEGLIIEKISNNCSVFCLTNYKYDKNSDVIDGSIQIVYFPISEKELNKRFKLLANNIQKGEEVCGMKKEKI